MTGKPENACLSSEQSLTLNAWLDPEVQIWIAPEGTTEFHASDTMTTAAGNAKEIEVPKAAGEYKLYIQINGNFSKASKAAVKVEP